MDLTLLGWIEAALGDEVARLGTKGKPDSGCVA